MDEIITLRSAKLLDCTDLAKLDNVASHGLSVWYWQNDEELSGKASVSEAEAIKIGAQRMADTKSRFGFHNAVIAQRQDKVAGFAVGFTCKQNNVATSKEQNPVLKPVAELYDQCDGGWWLDGIAVYPQCRNFGIGSRLLDDCFKRAKLDGRERILLAAEDSNVEALGLYRSRGFVERDRRRCVPFKSGITTEYWLLMEAPVT